MHFVDLNDDVKIIIAKNCTGDYFISQCLCLNIKTFKQYYLERLYG